MMRAILGSAAGGVVAGVIALVASAQSPRVTETAWSPSVVPSGNPYAMPVVNAPALRSALTNSPTLVDCEPGQRAVLQQTVIEGRQIARVACMTEQPVQPMVAYGTPAAYYDARVAPQPDIVQRPVVQRVVSRPRTTRVVSQREVEPQRSWKKTALVIGGSTGAGAGIGGLIGGKKGALIGAAIGGGGATIYEATKR
jgi:hypothetical protein